MAEADPVHVSRLAQGALSAVLAVPHSGDTQNKAHQIKRLGLVDNAPMIAGALRGQQCRAESTP